MISVIVPALNEEKDLGSCLKALSRQKVDEDYETIVVDGGSGDGTVRVAEEIADLVISQSSRGIGGARRDGAAAACGEKLAFTDADTIVSPDWMREISSNPTARTISCSQSPQMRTCSPMSSFSRSW